MVGQARDREERCKGVVHLQPIKQTVRSTEIEGVVTLRDYLLDTGFA